MMIEDHDKMKNSWFLYEPWGAFWEKGYREQDVSTMGGPSGEVLELHSILEKGSKVLDLGCGEGRNSLYLASVGCNVTAVDRSSAGIAKLSQLANSLGLDIKAIVADIRDFHFEDNFDIIMSHGVLHLIDRENVISLLRKIRTHTRPGGINIHTVHIFREEYPPTDEFLSAGYADSLSRYELSNEYSDWLIVRKEDYVKWDSHFGIGTHYHPVEKIVAVKSPCKFKYNTQPLWTVVPSERLTKQDFLEIEIGSPFSEISDLYGEPDFLQYYSLSETTGKYSNYYKASLKLAHYGQYVLYISGEAVSGKALFFSPYNLVSYCK